MRPGAGQEVNPRRDHLMALAQASPQGPWMQVPMASLFEASGVAPHLSSQATSTEAQLLRHWE